MTPQISVVSPARERSRATRSTPSRPSPRGPAGSKRVETSRPSSAQRARIAVGSSAPIVTPAGRAVVDDVAPRSEAAYRAIEAQLGAGELAALIASLERVANLRSAG